tara:strand:+ start:3118 stop:4011 length:894 start_codon:yes stop_codon:yes gene_type:complete
MTKAIKLALGSIAIGCGVFALKFLAYWITGSVALLSDAIESIVNIAAAAAALLALRISAMPADDNHPYGHSKVEYFSAVLEGVLIVIAALAIFATAGMALTDPAPIAAPIEGLAVNGLATAINLGWALVLLRHGRRTRSPALTADGRHLMADVVTSAGVIVGVALVGLTGWLALDPILAMIVALNILWSGWRMIRESVGGLMDEAVPQETMDEITALIATHASGAIQAHDVRTRHSGPTTFIEFHLVVPGDMTVSESHAICDRIEAAIRAGAPQSVITIHVEPEYKAKRSAVQVAAD